MYPVVAVGLLLLARARLPGGDRASLLDSLTITLGVGLLSWTFLIGPSVRAPGEVLVRLTAAAYPLGDVLVLAMLAHLWSSGGLRNSAGRLLAIGAVGILIADSLYGLANLHTSWNWHDGNPADLGWIVFYSCWGAAALHPSMRVLSAPPCPAAAEPRGSAGRLMLLAAASLIAPGVLLVESALNERIDGDVIALVAAAMFLLVLIRLADLVRVNQQAVMRERVLRSAAAELVAAPGKAGIYEAAITAVNGLIPGHRGLVGVTFAVSAPAGGLTVMAQSGDPSGDRLMSLVSSPRTCDSRSTTDGRCVAPSEPSRRR